MMIPVAAGQSLAGKHVAQQTRQRKPVSASRGKLVVSAASKAPSFDDVFGRLQSIFGGASKAAEREAKKARFRPCAL